MLSPIETVVKFLRVLLLFVCGSDPQTPEDRLILRMIEQDPSLKLILDLSRNLVWAIASFLNKTGGIPDGQLTKVSDSHCQYRSRTNKTKWQPISDEERAALLLEPWRVPLLLDYPSRTVWLYGRKVEGLKPVVFGLLCVILRSYGAVTIDGAKDLLAEEMGKPNYQYEDGAIKSFKSELTLTMKGFGEFNIVHKTKAYRLVEPKDYMMIDHLV